ncbi:MAG: right-handed parallel beta-helix repeat-containing protein [bacterium]
MRKIICSLGYSHRLTLLGANCIGFALSVMPIATAFAENGTAYIDDTHAVLQNDIDIEAVNGDFGFETYIYNKTANGVRLALDARKASFIVANSKNSYPTYDSDCENGSLQINRYPIKVYNADKTWVVGGIVIGEIPQKSDWKPTYCNSAAVIFKDAAKGAVDGLRITSAWDGIRAAADSPDLRIKNTWISNVRDDAVENDDFHPLVFEDNLVDGAFQGISVHSGGDITSQSEATIAIYGNVIRIREYLYKDRQQYGALFKNEDSSPGSIIHDTVVAVEYKGGKTFKGYWDRSWSKIENCSNNLFLWLSDQPIPARQPLPPACFKILTGEAARAEWDRAKQNWIDCHPEISRRPSDPASDPRQCTANTYGGYSG